MKFKRVIKRRTYPTWVSAGRYKGCKISVMQIPGVDKYHFQIVSDNDIAYMCLSDSIQFDCFDECCMAAMVWIEKNR